MARAIKLKNNTYLDTRGIVHNRQILSDKLLLPYTLYEGYSNDNITLNDNVGNYRYIEIYYTDATKTMVNSSKVNSTNGLIALLYLSWIYDTSIGGVQNYFKRVQLNTNQINNIDSSAYNVDINGTWSAPGNYIYIFRVVGYK